MLINIEREKCETTVLQKNLDVYFTGNTRKKKILGNLLEIYIEIIGLQEVFFSGITEPK